MKAVLDTNVLIDFFRNPNHKQEFEARTLRPQFFMSSVVVMELFAGCRTKREQSELKSFLKPFERAKRVFTPDHSAFLEAGIVLARLGAQGVDIVRRRQLVNNILVAVTAARAGAVVITANARDFTLIEVYAQVRWMLPVYDRCAAAARVSATAAAQRSTPAHNCKSTTRRNSLS